MKLFLLRHGHPDYDTSSRSDPGLSVRGVKALHELGERVKDRLACITRLYASPMLRTQQTAEIMQSYLPSDLKLETLIELSPDSNVAKIISWIEHVNQNDCIMLVGHHPELYALAHHLLPQGEIAPILNRGTLVAFELPVGNIKGVASVSWSDT